MTEGEVDALVDGVTHGVLSAYYALHLHYSMEVDEPGYAQYWLDRGVEKGEPNLSLIRASREELEAAGTKDADTRRTILLSEKQHLEAALDHRSTLTVGKPETVREQLHAVNAMLGA